MLIFSGHNTLSDVRMTSISVPNLEHHFSFEPTSVREFMCKVSHFIHKMNNCNPSQL